MLSEHLTAACMASQEPRHQVTLLCFLGTLVAYVERVGFSIAFTEMAKQAGTSEAVKGAVLSAFYWGYSLSQVRSLSTGIPVARGCVSCQPVCPSLQELEVYLKGSSMRPGCE